MYSLWKIQKTLFLDIIKKEKNSISKENIEDFKKLLPYIHQLIYKVHLTNKPKIRNLTVMKYRDS